MKAFAQRVVEARWFEPAMIGPFVLNGALIGLETSHDSLPGSRPSRRKSLNLMNLRNNSR